MMVEASKWCILRTAGPRTLPLAKSLGDAGLEVWTPASVVQRRQGRSRERVDVDAPIMPTFVFARAHHLSELLGYASSPISPHPSFSVFHYYDRIPILADREIEALRTVEGRARLARRKAERHVFPAGQKVCVPDGPFAGLIGVVEDEGNGKYALVCFGEWRLKVATFLLQPSDVEQTKHISGAAA
jgi:transcription antitermination factor NusG